LVYVTDPDVVVAAGESFDQGVNVTVWPYAALPVSAVADAVGGGTTTGVSVAEAVCESPDVVTPWSVTE